MAPTPSFALAKSETDSAKPFLPSAETGALPEPDTADPATTAPRDSPRTVARDDQKSPSRALLYSLGGTIGPVAGSGALAAGASLSTDQPATFSRVMAGALFLGGWIWGPSAGHFYADASRRAWTGMGLRTAGFLVSGLGQAWYHHRTAEAERDGASLAGIIGVVIVIGSAAYNIRGAPCSAQNYNEAHGSTAQVMPTVGPQGKQVGLSLRLQF